MHQCSAYTMKYMFLFNRDEEISEDLDKYHKKIWIVILILSES